MVSGIRGMDGGRSARSRKPVNQIGSKTAFMWCLIVGRILDRPHASPRPNIGLACGQMCALGVQLPHERSKNLQIQVILGLSSGADLWQRRAQSAPISLESGSVVSRLPETDGLCIQ